MQVLKMKEHPEHKGYFITEDGEVWSYWRNRGRDGWGIVLDKEPKKRRFNNHCKGYLTVWIKTEEGQKLKKVHRLVAETYIPNPNNLPQVNHIDGIKTNNNVSNLEWCSNQKNTELALAKVHQLVTPTGEIVEVFNLGKFCREHKIDRGDLYKGKKSKGYYLQ
jgi:hypothetical protein